MMTSKVILSSINDTVYGHCPNCGAIVCTIYNTTLQEAEKVISKFVPNYCQNCLTLLESDIDSTLSKKTQGELGL